MLSQRSFFIAWWGLRILVMSRSKIYLTTQRLDLSSPSSMTKAYYWDTCGSPVIKCLCFFVVFFFSSATKWKNCAIVLSGHWVLNTITTNCDPMRCSHADHACYLDDDWRCHAQTGPGHMTNHEILLIKLFGRLFCISMYLDCGLLEHYGANA